MTRDPMLVAAEQYRAALAAFDTQPEDLERADPKAYELAEAKWLELYLTEDLPEITTPAGAVAALRVAIEEEAFADGFAENMAKAALAFLERHHGAGGAV